MSKFLALLFVVLSFIMASFMTSCKNSSGGEYNIWTGYYGDEWGLYDSCSGYPSGGGSSGGGGGSQPPEKHKLTSLSVSTTGSVELGSELYFSVVTEPSTPDYGPVEGEPFDANNIKCFIYFENSGEYVSVSRNSYGNYTYPVTTTERMTIYAVYCTHGTVHYDGSGDLMSRGVTVECSTGTISTPEELKSLAGSSGTFILGADIDLSGEDGWTPIEGFNGKLYGEGHSITNMTVSAIEERNLGLFATLGSSAEIHDLIIKDAKISVRGESGEIGLLAGVNAGVISGVSVEGDISATYCSNVGGIVGKNEGGKIVNSTSEAMVNAKANVGGIAGYLSYELGKAPDGNRNIGTVKGKTNVGGIAGYLTSVSPGTSLTNMINDGEVEGTDNIGGLFGEVNAENLTLTLLINNAAVSTNLAGSCTGGIVGRGTKLATVSYCENYGEIKGVSYVGGLVGYSPSTNIKSAGFENSVSVSGRTFIGGYAGYAGLIEVAVNNGIVASSGTSSTGEVHIGGIAGFCTGLIDCRNNADIIVNNSGSHVGGLAGSMNLNSSDNITGNENHAEIRAQGSYVGGIVGALSATGGHTISDCENYGIVTGVSAVGGLFGGIIGDNTVSLTLVLNEGPVTGDISGSYVGGLVGNASAVARVYICESYGDVYGGSYVGGLVGYAPNATLDTEGYTNNNEISGVSSVGGLAGYAYVVNGGANNGTIVAIASANNQMFGGVVGECVKASGCINMADIEFEGAVSYVGGIAGKVYFVGDGAIENNQNFGEITSAGSYIGGIVGELSSKNTPYLTTYTFTMDNNENNASVTGVSHVGGIAGRVVGIHRHQPGPFNYGDYYFYVKFTLASNNAEIFGESYVGGIVGSATLMHSLDSTNSTLYGELLGS